MKTITNNCSNQIGITGDKSCPELKEVIHCRNCSIYSSIGRTLFEREAPTGYLQEWTDLLAQPLLPETVKSDQASSFNQKADPLKESAISVIIFRLEEEWLALPLKIIQEITQVVSVHTLPHRSNKILKGIVNIRGEIITCISLANLLALKAKKYEKQNYLSKNSRYSVIYQRMILIEIKTYRWVFKVDEIDSINRFDSKDFEDSPTALAKNPDTYTKKIIKFNHKNINYLDSELLFYELLFYTYSKPGLGIGK